MTFRACGYGPRFGDPIGIFVSLIEGEAEKAAERAAEFERDEMPAYCDDESCDGTCALCDPDIAVYGEFSYRAKDLLSAAELREHRRALLAGEVVCLSR